MREALPREEVIKAIEHKDPSRVPMMIHQWNWADAFDERAEQVKEIQSQYPQDALFVWARQPRVWDNPSDPEYIPNYCWVPSAPPEGSEVHGHDAQVAIKDWAQLDEMLEKWPDPSDMPDIFVSNKETLDKDAKGRYTGIHWAYCLYERMWSLRGMENILCDFYENPEHVHRFMDALTDFHCAMIRKGAKELQVDSVWTTDDIGMQTGPMFSPAVFKEFFKPRYAKMVKTAHDCGLHFWLHTCGDVRLFMDDLIEVGVDVIHPIQKYTMDEREIAERFGGKICVWTGMDVQQILPRGSTDDVRREVRFMIDTFDRPDGGCMVTAGNGITPDVPVENLLAFYDETYNYGMAHREKR